jgi:membrane protein DedA with SNARE-associated domain
LERIHRLIKRYHDAIILGFRFMVGFRLITPLLLGMVREVRPGCFALLNGISAAIWSVLVACGGCFLGEVMKPLLKEVKYIRSVSYHGG